MKQHIIAEQLDELTDTQKKNLLDWYVASDGDHYASRGNSRSKDWLTFINSPDSRWGYEIEPGEKVTVKNLLPLLSIGQMIEFIKQKYDRITISEMDCHNNKLWLVNSFICPGNWLETKEKANKAHEIYSELCDSLWEAVKEVLAIDKEE